MQLVELYLFKWSKLYTLVKLCEYFGTSLYYFNNVVRLIIKATPIDKISVIMLPTQ